MRYFSAPSLSVLVVSSYLYLVSRDNKTLKNNFWTIFFQSVNLTYFQTTCVLPRFYEVIGLKIRQTESFIFQTKYIPDKEVCIRFFNNAGIYVQNKEIIWFWRAEHEKK